MIRLLKKLFGRKQQNDQVWTEEIIIEEPFTPVNRYVNLLLLEMSKTDSCTKVLSRNETLTPLTDGFQIIQPPSINAVLKRLKQMCSLKRKSYSSPIEGQIPVMIEGRTFSVQCHFDESSDICCRIKMERTKEN
jgi:hypothetical protein